MINMAMGSRYNSSSSSMSTGQSCFSYHVFLSFRGEDTRKGFTDHLYTALKQAGIRTFRDDDAMDRGKLLKPELDKAIHESAISVIVFSESYASSKWCLDEVCMIMEQHKKHSSSKHEVIPVFYKVNPSDIRNQTGSFVEAFDAYDDEVNAETDLEMKTELLKKVGAWRDSLRQAATFTGFVYKDGYESKFINDIVNVIRKKLDYKALYIEKKLVGIKDHVAKIESWLQDPSPDAVVLVIDGMGGIGKTTIAKCIYNSNTRNYDASCFLANINETSNQPGGLLRLQSQLLSTLSKTGKEETIWNVHEGTIKVADAIYNRKVFVILDDVTTLQQLEALLGPQRFYHGSKVIITTRHKELLTAFTVHPKVQSVSMLYTNDAIELFSLYAFGQNQPIEAYIVQSQLFVRYCNGLPLALKVLGSSLRGNTNDVWEDTMRKLKAIPNPEIQKILQISYEALADDEEKDLFLHVACFFEGEEKDYIVKLLAACDLYPVVGIKNLRDRCLVYLEGGRVKMHQLIKEMGREVVRQESPKEPGKRSRLWHRHDCFTVLQDNVGTKRVQGLMLDVQNIKVAKSTLAIRMTNGGKRSFEEYLGITMQGNDTYFDIGALEKMKNLTLLQLNYVTFSGKCKKLPKKLRLLSWHGFSLEAIPCDICLEKLVVLDMSYSKLKHVWDDFKFIGSLKILNLSYSIELIETPDFDGLPGLESLILKGCLSLTKVCKSITYLKKLVLLDLTDCISLREFPCLPRSLVSLKMSGCSNHGVLEKVRYFDSSSLPCALVNMTISNCNLFDNSFPNDWSSLVSLRNLKIEGTNITSLPKCIQTLPTIRNLYVGGCSKIQSIYRLPESVDTLVIWNNDSLEKVQPTPYSRIRVYHDGRPTFCELEGRYKVRSIDKVERKIIRYLGLKSLDPGLKVLHEFGIFSIFVSEKQIPSHFMYKKRGSQISFEVPWQHNSSRISGFNMCAVLSASDTHTLWAIEVYNRTKDLRWNYKMGYQKPLKNLNKCAWLSIWRCDSLLEGGNEIVISVDSEVVQECCINLLYEDDDEELLDGEINKGHCVNAFDHLSWNDRMHRNISDYVDNGKTYSFQSDYGFCFKSLAEIILYNDFFLRSRCRAARANQTCTKTDENSLFVGGTVSCPGRLG